MRLYDIKYRGERIIYELGLQEAIAHYAGNDPVQSGTAYLGRSFQHSPLYSLSFIYSLFTDFLISSRIRLTLHLEQVRWGP